jgi:bacterial/archaeal transporter family-2 protein
VTATLYVLAAVLVGGCAATQAAMLAAMGREKTPYEATWINMAAAIAGIALVLVVRGIGGRPPLLPAPFDRIGVFVAVGLIMAVALAVSVKGLEPYYAITGLFALAYLLGIGFAAPKIGVALFLAGVTVGQLGGAVVYDHWGAFGNAVHSAGTLRVVGMGIVVVGAVIVRFAD